MVKTLRVVCLACVAVVLMAACGSDAPEQRSFTAKNEGSASPPTPSRGATRSIRHAVACPQALGRYTGQYCAIVFSADWTTDLANQLPDVLNTSKPNNICDQLYQYFNSSQRHYDICAKWVEPVRIPVSQTLQKAKANRGCLWLWYQHPQGITSHTTVGVGGGMSGGPLCTAT